MSATVTNINTARVSKKIEQLDEDLDHQLDMWIQALHAGQPTRELFRILKETEAEIDLLEERVL